MKDKVRYYIYRARNLPPKDIIKKIFTKIKSKIGITFDKIHAHLFANIISDKKFLQKTWDSAYNFNNTKELQNYFMQRKDPKLFFDKK